MHPDQHRALNDLLKSIRYTFEVGITETTEVADELVKMLDLFDNLSSERVNLEPQYLNGCRYLAPALSAAESDAGLQLAHGLSPLSESLRWIQTPNYVNDEKMRSFVGNYGYNDIIGPRGYVPSQSIAVGFLLMGPHLFYPPHHHPATEVYFVVSGHARWQRGDEPWQIRPPGTFILHPSGVSHAMQTEEEPLLALYVWRDYLDIDATLT
ncbi:MAG: dimethylsulfonioproprionate lyase family protein [Ardenticatenaceae bacterium]